MSDKIILKERTTKNVKLPETGATIEIFASVMVADLQGFDLNDSGFENTIKVLSKIIKSWNIFASQKDESPKPINQTTISELPLQDLTFLIGEIEAFASAQKKS